MAIVNSYGSLPEFNLGCFRKWSMISSGFSTREVADHQEMHQGFTAEVVHEQATWSAWLLEWLLGMRKMVMSDVIMVEIKAVFSDSKIGSRI